MIAMVSLVHLVSEYYHHLLVFFLPTLNELSYYKVIALEGLNISLWNLFGNIKLFETNLSPLHEINLEIQVPSALNEKQTGKILCFYKNRDYFQWRLTQQYNSSNTREE